MDCRTCQPTLIDLLHGELATDAAEEAHAHLSECASCRGAFDKLSHGVRLSQSMPVLEPPQAVGARLLQLAEEHARAAVVRRQPPAREPIRPWQSLLDFIGRFAMARQVGMATLMLLIVAVGMWSLPQLQRSRMADGGTVVNAVPDGEAAPSAAAAPSATMPPSPSLAAPAEMPAAEEASPVAASESRAEGELDRLGTRTPARRLAERGDRASAPALGRARAGGASVELSKAKREAQPFPDSAAQPEYEARKRARALPGTLAPERGPADDDALAGLSEGSGRSASAANRQQTTAAPAAAAPEPAPAAAATEPAPAPQSATRAEAKSASAPAGPCEPATMRRYQNSVDAAPASAAAGEALLAMARCRRLSGEHTLARALLERAARNQYVAARARAMLDATARPAKPAASAPAEAESEPAGRP